MVIKFEQVNKSFDSFKPLLSKVLTNFWKMAQLKLTVLISKIGKFGLLSFQRSTFYQLTNFT